MLWLDPRLQVCVVQELRGHNRLVPPGCRDQRKHVRWRDSVWLTQHSSGWSLTPKLCFSADPKLFSIVSKRRTSAFTPALSPTRTELRPASPSLRKVRDTGDSCDNIFQLLHPCWSPHLSLSELKRLQKLSHDHKFPSECLFCFSCYLLIQLDCFGQPSHSSLH